jgi:hypothetical protein
MRKFLRQWWWLLAVALAALITAGIEGYHWEANPPGDNWINYCKIRKGMTYKEVASFAGPAREIDRVNGDLFWFHQEGDLVVGFGVSIDAGTRITGKWQLDGPPGILQRVQQWFIEHLI